MHKTRSMLLMAVVAGCFLTGMGDPVRVVDPPRLSTDELRLRLGEEGLVILDVRIKADWKRVSEKIVGAVRVDPDGADKWAGDYGKEKTIVLYCA